MNMLQLFTILLYISTIYFLRILLKEINLKLTLSLKSRDASSRRAPKGDGDGVVTI